MFDVNSIDRSTFFLQEENVFIKEGLSLKTKIFRYTSFDNLQKILEDKKFRLSNRNTFSDRREKGEFYDSKLHFYRFSVAGEQADEKTLKEWGYKNAQIRKACELPTSCWTTKKDEDFLLWKAYTEGETGVRIETTIEKLIGSLQNLSQLALYCAKMEYGKEKPFYEVMESMFFKTHFYRSEEEFRLYVIDNNRDKKDNAIFLDVKPQEMIEKIILSPFLSVESAKIKNEMLQEKYKFLKDKISISSIMEYKK